MLSGRRFEYRMSAPGPFAEAHPESLPLLRSKFSVEVVFLFFESVNRNAGRLCASSPECKASELSERERVSLCVLAFKESMKEPQYLSWLEECEEVKSGEMNESLVDERDSSEMSVRWGGRASA